MKKFSTSGKAPFLGLVLFAIFLFAASTTSAAAYEGIYIFPQHVGVFTEDGEQQFVAFAMDSNGDYHNVTREVEWQSSDTAKVSIDKNGLAQIKGGVTFGQVVITATYDSKKTLPGVNLLLTK